MRSQDAEAREAAIVALEKCTPRRSEVVTAYRERLLDPAAGGDECLRILDALDRFQDRTPDTLAAMEKLRNHPDAHVRDLAVTLLEKKG